MEAAVFDKLLTINREFYTTHAGSFSATRYNPQPGYTRLAQYLPDQCRSLLDVGCGNGRLGRFLIAQGRIEKYTGVDSSLRLLSIAEEAIRGEFLLRDLSEAGCLEGLSKFDVICCLATLHHLPGHDTRSRLISEIVEHLATDGLIILSTWQFLENSRQMKKVVDWSVVSLAADEVEQNDYLMTWGGMSSALRYVAYIDLEDINSYAERAGLTVADHFRSDGQEGDLNLYAVLKR